MSPAVTLDGFIANLDGECYSWINPADEARYEKVREVGGCELVGRKTYEQYFDDFNSGRNVMTFVYTHQSRFTDTDKIKFIHGAGQEVLDQIAQYGFSQLLFSGGGELNGLLATAGVIDEIIVSIHAIVLGAGIPIFGSYKPSLKLKLLSTDQNVEGVVQNRYQVIRQPGQAPAKSAHINL